MLILVLIRLTAWQEGKPPYDAMVAWCFYDWGAIGSLQEQGLVRFRRCSKSNKTNKEIAEQIGKATVHNTAVTESHGQQGSYSEADQILGRYLIDPAEIGRLERDERLALITGVPAFRSRKFSLEGHPRYKELK